MLLTKTHRELEKKHNCKRGSLKEAVAYLKKVKANIPEVEKGCEDYCKFHGYSYEVAFNLYASCLKNPK